MKSAPRRITEADLAIIAIAKRVERGYLLRNTRVGKGLSQTDVAKSAGISLASYADLESGIESSDADIDKVFKILGIPSDLSQFND